MAASIALGLMSTVALRAQPAKPLDSAVKAVYLLNFGRFATWPPMAPSAGAGSFDVCVLGRDPFGPTLDATVATEVIDGKNVVARRIAAPGDAIACRILFVSGSEERQLKPILQAVDAAAVLTVSDMPRFVERGGMIQFVLENNKVRFEINLVATAHAGLTLSSELLRVAASVRTTTKPEA
jgi:hypothetical protein